MSLFNRIGALCKEVFRKDETQFSILVEQISTQLPISDTEIFNTVEITPDRFTSLLLNVAPMHLAELLQRMPKGYDATAEVFRFRNLTPSQLENFVAAGVALNAVNERGESLLWLINPMDCAIEEEPNSHVKPIWERILDAGPSINDTNIDGITRVHAYFARGEHKLFWLEEGDEAVAVTNLFRMHMRAITANGRYLIDTTKIAVVKGNETLEQLFVRKGLGEEFFNCLMLNRYFLIPVNDVSNEEIEQYKASSEQFFEYVVERAVDANATGRLSKAEFQFFLLRLGRERCTNIIRSKNWTFKAKKNKGYVQTTPSGKGSSSIQPIN